MSLDTKIRKVIKKKKCRFCKKIFQPKKPLQVACSLECAVELANQKKEKKEREKKKEWRAYVRKEKDRLKSYSDWVKDLQKVFNKFIRIRDRNLPCISCGKSLGRKYDAGHYRSVGSTPELRFNEMNVHAQCVLCNHHLHGNLINYRIGLIERCGLDVVEELEKAHPPLKLSIPEIKEKIEEYRKKIKELK